MRFLFKFLSVRLDLAFRRTNFLLHVANRIDKTLARASVRFNLPISCAISGAGGLLYVANAAAFGLLTTRNLLLGAELGPCLSDRS